MQYTMLSNEDKKVMLEKIGVNSIDDLFADLPKDILVETLEGLPEPLSEMEVESLFENIAMKNNIKGVPYCGGGVYEHYVPASIDELASRSEFYTAYTPYQPEVSQGTLISIFEYQTNMCILTGMDVANASLYDGATALAESVMMSCKEKRRKKILVSEAVNPLYRKTLQTYCWAVGIEIVEVPCKGLESDIEKLALLLDDSIANVVIQSPNFFGVIEELGNLAIVKDEKKADLIFTVSEAVSLALLKTPKEQGADIVCGEAMSFGNYPSFGGPLLGFMCAKESYMRKIPGRLVGLTQDENGEPCFALTLQAREQHIRRDKATSNICSNQGLVALRAAIYLSLVGPKLSDVAQLNHSNASYLQKRLIEIGFTRFENSMHPFFNEFVLKKPCSLDKSFTFGIDIGKWYSKLKDCILVCATEKDTKESIDDFIEAIKGGVKK